MFPGVDYLGWVFEHEGTTTYSLASSGLTTGEGSSSVGEPPMQTVIPPQLEGRSDDANDRTLEELIAERYGVPPDHVVVTAGASHANLLALAGEHRLATEQGTPDDPVRVAVERPTYEPLYRSAEPVGAEVVRFDRGDVFDPDPTVPRESDVMVVTNRHNPSGRHANRADLERLAAAAAEADTRLLVDEVYAPYTSEPRTGDGTAFGGPTAAGLPDTVVTSSLTKFFGLGGLCLGWIVADPAFVRACLPAFSHTPVVATPSRALGRRAMLAADEIAADARTVLRANHAALASFVDDRDDLHGAVPAGSPFAFLRHGSADGDAVVDAAMEHDVLVTPGRFFDDPSGVRVALGRAPEHVEPALARFAQALDSLGR